MNTQPYWRDFEIPAFEPLQTDLEVDTLIVGGGITGVTTAHLLAAAGLRVALVERETIAARDTGHTTAHLTYMTDTRLSKLATRNGEEAARTAWQAGEASMGFIRQTVQKLGLDCEFKTVPGYLAVHSAGKVEEEGKRPNEISPEMSRIFPSWKSSGAPSCGMHGALSHPA
jgi:glycine/D-amino acid oxidase-like deaminating enzyme